MDGLTEQSISSARDAYEVWSIHVSVFFTLMGTGSWCANVLYIHTWFITKPCPIIALSLHTYVLQLKVVSFGATYNIGKRAQQCSPGI